MLNGSMLSCAGVIVEWPTSDVTAIMRDEPESLRFGYRKPETLVLSRAYAFLKLQNL